VRIDIFLPILFNIDCLVVCVEMQCADVICMPMLALERRWAVRVWTGKAVQWWLHDGHNNSRTRIEGKYIVHQGLHIQGEAGEDCEVSPV
jgi:hypothetical protein